jgi:Methylamine utilisation protein MauE
VILTAISEVQIPLLAAMLLGACVAKLAQVLKAGGLSAAFGPTSAFGPTALFPVSMRRPVAVSISVIEFSLGLGLILTAGNIGGHRPAEAFRAATCLFFVVATCALVELRASRPDLGCGCFGDFSTAPVSFRTLARSALLAVAAAVTVQLGPIVMPPLHLSAYAEPLGILAAELLIIGALSPEIGEGLIRLGYSEPCELQTVPSGRTLTALHRSRQWRRYATLITSSVPADIWRELCWRYVVFPASYENRPADLVFAVFLKYRRPAIRAALVDSATGQSLPWPEIPTRRRLARGSSGALATPAEASGPVPLAGTPPGLATSPTAPVLADLPISTDV